MKKLYFLAISVLALASCSHDLGDYDESIRKPTKEEINKNIAEIFGSIDPNQDWNVHSSGTVSITANAPLYDIVEVQILTGSPFFSLIYRLYGIRLPRVFSITERPCSLQSLSDTLTISSQL